MIDSDLKEYLSVQFKALSDKIDQSINPIQKDLDRHREDIDDLYDKDREHRDKLNKMETQVSGHLDDHEKETGKKRFSIEMWIIVGIFALDKLHDWVELGIQNIGK